MFPRKPHEKRLADFMRSALPSGWPKDPVLAAHLRRTAEMDLAARAEIKKRLDQIPLLIYAGWESSSGLRMATELRRFWYEYFSRFARFGPTSLPSNFNVNEAFVEFDRAALVFRLRSEHEHLLRYSEYLDWYTASSFPEEPRSLIDIMDEGVSYSYDFVLDDDEPRLAAEEASLVVAGISMIRHADEVAVLALAGETPPISVEGLEDGEPMAGKEELGPAEGLNEDDRLLDGMPECSRVLLATRFDLSNRLNDVRYVLRDRGKSYSVATDDFEMLRFSLGRSVGHDKFRQLIDRQVHDLRRYRDLFSAVAASIFLPAFFIDRHASVVETEFLTNLGADSKTSKVKRIRRELGDEYFRPVARVKCLASSSACSASEYSVTPPEMKFESTGYWRPLEAGQIGTNADGVPIIGKTWVHRSETWESTPPAVFVAKPVRAVSMHLVFCPRYICNNNTCESRSLFVYVHHSGSDSKNSLLSRTPKPDMCAELG